MRNCVLHIYLVGGGHLHFFRNKGQNNKKWILFYAQAEMHYCNFKTLLGDLRESIESCEIKKNFDGGVK